jgi:hypothetical protein
MDPNATWKMLCEALQELEAHPDDTPIREHVVELLEALAAWLRKGGFPPSVIHTPIRGALMIRFPLGRVVATPGALAALEKAEQLPAEFLDRHVNGDWGEVPDADKQENELSVEQGLRILSAYTTSAGDKLWILTEADRSATILMLPEEY